MQHFFAAIKQVRNIICVCVFYAAGIDHSKMVYVGINMGITNTRLILSLGLLNCGGKRQTFHHFPQTL